MGDANLHARKVLLRRYEAAAMALERQETEKQVMFQAGKIRALAEVLHECRHVGDDMALSGDEWENDADRRIAAALLRIEQKAAGMVPETKDPFAPMKQFVGQIGGFDGKSLL